MMILALEFSSAQRSAAIVAGTSSADARCLGRASDTRGQGAKPLSLIDCALRAAQVERGQIECLVVGLGPGSYTGIRAAIAVTQGWQLARATPSLGISSVEVLALEAQRAGRSGPLGIAVDAQRGEFYLASYELTQTERSLVTPLRLAKREELRDLLASGVRVVGPDMASLVPQAEDLFPSAPVLGALASGRQDFLPANRLEPIYLRPIAFVKAPAPRIEVPP